MLKAGYILKAVNSGTIRKKGGDSENRWYLLQMHGLKKSNSQISSKGWSKIRHSCDKIVPFTLIRVKNHLEAF
jgi:hypothetical protein